MASRRDELNAYTFAKKRLVAQFLQPSPTGTEEGAPRPLRAVAPGLIIGVLIMAGFGAWGMFKPKAPDGWDTPYEKVIIGSDSTTRYVVLKTNGHKQLHPVLNLTSAKLLLTSRTVPPSASRTHPTACRSPGRRRPRSAGRSANTLARAAGRSRRPPSSSPSARTAGSRGRTGCPAAR